MMNSSKNKGLRPRSKKVSDWLQSQIDFQDSHFPDGCCTGAHIEDEFGRSIQDSCTIPNDPDKSLNSYPAERGPEGSSRAQADLVGLTPCTVQSLRDAHGLNEPGIIEVPNEKLVPSVAKSWLNWLRL